MTSAGDGPDMNDANNRPTTLFPSSPSPHHSGRFTLPGNIKREESIWEVAGEVEHRRFPSEHPLAFDDLSQGGITSFPAPVGAETV